MTRSIRDILTPNDRVGAIVTGMSREQYDSVAALNFSTVKSMFIGANDLDPSLAKDTWEHVAPEPLRDLQDSFDRGTLLHLILLQPELIASRVAEYRGFARHGKEWEEFQVANAGKLIMRQADIRDVQIAARAFKSIPEVRDLLKPCDTEVAVFGQEGGIYTRALLDAVSRDGVVTMIDPKSTRKGIDEQSVDRQIRTCYYREQMGWYWHAYNRAADAIGKQPIEKVKLLFVSLPPQRLGCYVKTLTTSALQWGASRVLDAMRVLEESIQKDHWPVFCGDGICDVSEWEVDADKLEGFDE